MSTTDLLALAPELFLAITAMVFLVAGVSMRGAAVPGIISIGAVGALVIAAVLSFTVVPDTIDSAFGGAFAIDVFAQTARIFVFLAATISLLLAGRFFQHERLSQFEYPILVILAAAGMGLMVTANDLITLYLGIELQSLALYIMAAFNRDSRRSTEAGLKYFVLGALSSGLLLYGSSLIYGFTGSTTFAGIAEACATSEYSVGLTFGLVFLMAGLAFKVSGAPFHMWTPDVYEGAPTPVTAFFAAAPKLAAMFLFVRVMIEAFAPLYEQWWPIIWFVSAASMIVGSISALVQKNIKRLMAYSSIGHVGYALIGLTAGTPEGVKGVIIYLGIYVIMTLGTFACILAMRRPEGMAENISDLSGLSQQQPGLAFAFTVLFFSLAGIPPLLGFFGKFAVFMAGVEAELYILLVIGVVTSVIATFYYLSVIRTIWFSEPGPAFVKTAGPSVSLTLAGSTGLVLLGLAIVVPFLFQLASSAAASLF